MAEVSHDPGDLWGSRTLGTRRQLFRINEDGDFSDVQLRHPDSKASAGLAVKLSLMDFPAMCSKTIEPIDRIEESSMTTQEFKLAYERSPSRPAVVSGCTDKFKCPAGDKHWALERLRTSLGEGTRLEVAQQDCTVSIEQFIDYLKSDSAMEEDNPVYIFETLVDGEHDCLIDSFHVPRFFTSLRGDAVRGCHTPGDNGDLLSEAGEDGLGFGLHRWFLLGGQNSGSNLHTDPLGTGAWNTLLLGEKLWALFPPNILEQSLKTRETLEGGYRGSCEGAGACASSGGVKSHSQQPLDFCAAGWFAHVLPFLEQDVCAQKRLFVQKAGETVFVPAGWAHAVLNLSTTVCVTQNYASPHDYPRVARALYNDGGSETEAADEWRLKVADNCMWEEVLTVKAPGKAKQLHLARDHCVHCGRRTGGRVCSLLNDRPVCAVCESSELFQEEYALISDEEVKQEFGLHLLQGCAEEDEDIPPHVQRGGVSYFLRHHILQLMQELEDESEDE